MKKDKKTKKDKRDIKLSMNFEECYELADQLTYLDQNLRERQSNVFFILCKEELKSLKILENIRVRIFEEIFKRPEARKIFERENTFRMKLRDRAYNIIKHYKMQFRRRYEDR